MALDDLAVLKAGAGHFYTAPIGTPLPADLLNPEAAWINMGHTSVQSILAAKSTGGTVTTLMSLQSKSLKTAIAPRTEAFTVNLLQFDKTALKLYYGANAVETATGVRPSQNPVATEAAWLVVFIDGETISGIYAPKASFFRDSDLSIADTENLAQLPIAVTPLAYGTNDWTLEWYIPTPAKITATGTASESGGGVTAVSVTDGGSGYTAAPTVTFANATGDTTGAGAAATATITAGVVTAVSVTTAGTGYTAPPVVTFSAP